MMKDQNLIIWYQFTERTKVLLKVMKFNQKLYSSTYLVGYAKNISFKHKPTDSFCRFQIWKKEK